MNLGKFTRGAVIAAFMVSALTANAQSVSMWWNKSGDASTLQPPTVDVLPGQTITLSVYLSTSGFSSNLTAASVMFGYDTSTSSTDTATPQGSGLSVAHGGTNAAPTGIPMAWSSAFAGGAVINKFGGGFDASSAVRPWGLWTSNLNVISDFGFSNTAATKMFDIDVTVSNSLVAGDIRPITLYVSPTQVGAWDSNVLDGNSTIAFPQTYTANLRVISNVPEPASLAVLGLGAVALIRRRKK